ncbi:hypothetical protein ACJ51O_35625 (plasmid) [Burkholderia pyrrocinia]|uniref:hypothetical protein n=1 Tax=Burkholderia pyrrocinia TaxID=60550 RepID=UPI0038B4AF36
MIAIFDAPMARLNIGGIQPHDCWTAKLRSLSRSAAYCSSPLRPVLLGRHDKSLQLDSGRRLQHPRFHERVWICQPAPAIAVRRILDAVYACHQRADGSIYPAA